MTQENTDLGFTARRSLHTLYLGTAARSASGGLR